MAFSSAAPDGALAGIVHGFWEVEGRLSPFRERVLPNACAEIMINLGPPHQMITHAGTSIWERAWFSGLHDRAIVIESSRAPIWYRRDSIRSAPCVCWVPTPPRGSTR